MDLEVWRCMFPAFFTTHLKAERSAVGWPVPCKRSRGHRATGAQKPPPCLEDLLPYSPEVWILNHKQSFHIGLNVFSSEFFCGIVNLFQGRGLNYQGDTRTENPVL